MATLTETIASTSRPHITQASPQPRQQKKPWQSRRAPSFGSTRSRTHPDPEIERLSREASRQTTSSTKRKAKWWKVRLFRGMVDDVKRRLPYYWSDYRDAWDYRVVPATVYMYFAKYEYEMHSFLLRRTFPALFFVYHSCLREEISPPFKQLLFKKSLQQLWLL